MFERFAECAVNTLLKIVKSGTFHCANHQQFLNSLCSEYTIKNDSKPGNLHVPLPHELGHPALLLVARLGQHLRLALAVRLPGRPAYILLLLFQLGLIHRVHEGHLLDPWGRVSGSHPNQIPLVGFFITVVIFVVFVLGPAFGALFGKFFVCPAWEVVATAVRVSEYLE